MQGIHKSGFTGYRQPHARSDRVEEEEEQTFVDYKTNGADIRVRANRIQISGINSMQDPGRFMSHLLLDDQVPWRHQIMDDVRAAVLDRLRPQHQLHGQMLRSQSVLDLDDLSDKYEYTSLWVHPLRGLVFLDNLQSLGLL